MIITVHSDVLFDQILQTNYSTAAKIWNKYKCLFSAPAKQANNIIIAHS